MLLNLSPSSDQRPELTLTVLTARTVQCDDLNVAQLTKAPKNVLKHSVRKTIVLVLLKSMHCRPPEIIAFDQ